MGLETKKTKLYNILKNIFFPAITNVIQFTK